MCGRTVRLDDRGRCPLGHQVIAVEEVRADIVVRAPEPARPDPPDVDDVPDPAQERRDPSAMVVSSYVEAAPRSRAGLSGPASWSREANPTPGDTPAREAHDFAPPLFDDALPPVPTSLLGNDDLPHDRVAVPRSDLTPTAPSAVDVDAAAWTRAAPRQESTFPQEPLIEDEPDEPRGTLRLIAGALFVAVLLGVAWYLATSI